LARRNRPVLASIPFFADLRPEEMSALEQAVFYARYRRHQVLFLEGEPARTLYVVCRGKVKVYRSSLDGREHILHLLGDGQPVAVVPFFDGGPYPATAEVLEDSEIAALQFDDFQRVAEANPRILLQVVRELARRLRNAQEQIVGLSLKSVPARLAGHLLRLAELRGTPGPDGMQFDLGMNRQELGSLVGTSRETATRLLQRFQRDGAIRVDGSRITVLRPEKLRAWSEE